MLFSRLGRTDSQWLNLHDAGRLDLVQECVVASLFLSHGLRRNVTFHAILNGPPRPPLHLRIDGSDLFDVRTDLETWTSILKKTLNKKPHPGISMDKISFEELLRTKAAATKIYVMEEHGRNVEQVEISPNPVFVLGDHVGLPVKAEAFALRYGEKISLGKTPYLAASCISILNYLLDRRDAKLDS